MRGEALHTQTNEGRIEMNLGIEHLAQIAASRVYDAALRLSATPEDVAPNYHAGRSADFEDAMTEMAAVVDRWRAERAPKRAEAA